jgi:3-deoxy-7-phosphoheptulonate synthase
MLLCYLNPDGTRFLSTFQTRRILWSIALLLVCLQTPVSYAQSFADLGLDAPAAEPSAAALLGRDAEPTSTSSSVHEASRLDSNEPQPFGANLFRGGAFKPRTSPYAFQGMGEDGLKLLRQVGDKFSVPVVTEVTDPRLVELVAGYADMLQIGARNMQNFALLTEVGKTNRPVLLKRGMSATISDLLMCAEYILSQGNPNVVLCERGIKSFDPSTRNLFDVAAVPLVHRLSHLPIIVDPSHATGQPDLIPACALAGLAAGADGVHVEVHDCPEVAKSDGPQALLPTQYDELADQMKKLASLFGKHISPLPETIA